jgi:murein DD-endopeptidase MepM/ murein hydrolase activator NlpD
MFATVFTSMKWDALASNISDARDKKSSLEKKKDELENQVAELETKKNSIMEYIAALDKQLADIDDSIEELDYKIAATQTNLDKTKVELQKAEAEEARQYETMKSRIQSMYVNGNEQYIQIVLSSKSISDFLNRSEYVKQISNYDKTMFNEFKKIKEEVQQKKLDIEEDLANLEAMNEELLHKKKTVQKLNSDKQAELAKYNAAISKTSAEVASYNKAIEDAQDELDRLIAEQQQKYNTGNDYVISGNAAKGFVWPTPTSYRITCGFGYRNAPTAGASTYHKGIDIGLPTGSPIVATKAGTVAMASYNNARGYYVVISHGDGIMSYYYHNSKLLVSVGDKVSAGQQIAKAGSTGISTGPHLHFSITVNGTYVNPRKYVG